MLSNTVQRLLQLTASVTSRAADRRGHRLLTLIYHRVLEKPDFMHPDAVLRQKFEWQMALLARYFRVYPLSEAVRLQQEGILPARSVAITFDDGYADNYHTALPVLGKFGLPATFFVASGYLDGGRMWNDTVIEAVRLIRDDSLDMSAEGIGVLDLSSAALRAEAAEQVLRNIKHRNPVERERLTAVVVSRAGAGLPDDLMMTSENLRQLTASGMEIGGHTVTHPILANLSAQESSREIQGGKQALEQIVDTEVSLFAYPNGRLGDDYQEKDAENVRRSGFAAAVTTHLGVSEPATDRYQLPRFTPWNPTPAGFMAQMASMYRNVIS